MIYDIGFEEFTFKKLAQSIGTTEAGIYRYFENKHRLLTYLTTWFWTWMDYQIAFHTNNMADTKQKIHTVINLLTFHDKDAHTIEHIPKEQLHRIVVAEGVKSYLTKHITEDNKAMLFMPYKDLCHHIALLFTDYAPTYPYPHSLASTLIETAHHQIYFKDNLPRLTDYGGDKHFQNITIFLRHLVFSVLDAKL